MSGRDDWAPLCDRGRVAMTLRTRARIEAEGTTLADNLEMLGEVRPDDAPAFNLGFESLELAATFVHEMAPHSLELLAGELEDADAILAQVKHEPGTTIH